MSYVIFECFSNIIFMASSNLKYFKSFAILLAEFAILALFSWLLHITAVKDCPRKTLA